MSNDDLPLYASHKTVRAAKILAVNGGELVLQRPEPHSAREMALLPPQPSAAWRSHVGDEWIARHKPEAGGYYVVYTDGYTSFSPAKAFEEGYTRL